MTTGEAVELDATEKAAVLVEALPYIRRFWTKVVVVKFGGSAMHDAQTTLQFAEDVVLMRSVGMRPVVVHGGGPQIGEVMGRLGKAPEFRDGLRVTDAETLDIARMVLVGRVNRDIVATINRHGPLAVGMSGEDAGLISVVPGAPELGFVGEVEAVNGDILERLLNEALIPVVATIGAGPAGQSYNVNADAVAGAVAEALGAEKLVYLTDVEGVHARAGDPTSLVKSASADELEAMLEAGVVAGGMIPKVSAAVRAVRRGVKQAHVLDGRRPHALLLEFFTREGIGTMIRL